MLTIKYREDGSFDPQHRGVEVLAVAENVELDVVVAEAEYVSLLELGGEAVLHGGPGPHHAPRGHRPAVVILAEVSVEVRGRAAEARTPHAALLDLDLKITRCNYSGDVA